MIVLFDFDVIRIVYRRQKSVMLPNGCMTKIIWHYDFYPSGYAAMLFIMGYEQA